VETCYPAKVRLRLRPSLGTAAERVYEIQVNPQHDDGRYQYVAQGLLPLLHAPQQAIGGSYCVFKAHW
jgi:hypothetical protein